jgi:hypothetical protein
MVSSACKAGIAVEARQQSDGELGL